MDIEYLLWLQNFRTAIDDALTPFMMAVSDFAVGALVLIPVFIYWAVNKRNGLFILMAYSISNVINGIVKLTCCVYRPWIRDARVVPYGNSLKTAGGYSFPSGHTMESSPTYGGLAVLTRKRAPVIMWLCILGMIITAISRNYLGVHTPQDVIVGTILGLLSVYIASKITGYIYAHPERENMILAVMFIEMLLAGAYIAFKPYPMDYDASGKLIVDPVSMILSSIGHFGMLAGFITGRYVEKTFIKFKAERFTMKSCILALIGFVPLVLMDHKVRIWLSFIGKEPAKIIERFILGFFVMALWPLVLKLFRAGED